MSTNPPSKRDPAPVEDIPEAIRNVSTSAKAKSSKVYVSEPSGQRKVFWMAGAVVAVSLALVAGVFQWQQTHSASLSNATVSPTATAHPLATDAANAVLGHLAYAIAPESSLELVSLGDSILLRKPAAAAFREMTAAAAADGVSLVLISGFRNLEDQKHLFFDVKRDRGQTAKQRAEVSAPPGYSEHHTGYAIDIGDAQAPSANLNQSFEETAAFRWLQDNATQFSFELSFPKGNTQGVSYEPWHWRYVGDIDSLETFYKARSAK